jgi:hypothetical protein
MRRAAKRDKNEMAIVDTFRRLGWSVEFLSGRGVPDLLIGKGSTLLLIEVKGEKGKLTEDQVEWHSDWNGPKPRIVRSIDDALEISNRQLLGLPRCSGEALSDD